jgi:hypothetical protein
MRPDGRRQSARLGYAKLEQGIQAAGTIFGKSYFEAEKCAGGIAALSPWS